MATRNLVPRADNEGGVGTAAKKWASGFINALTIASIKITTGAAAGKFLKSDADGDASWGNKIVITVMLLDKGVALASGASLGNVQIPVAVEWNGLNITDCVASISPLGTASSSGAVTFNLVRTRSATPVDVLSSALSIAESATVSGAASINTSNDDLATGDFLSLDCEGAGTGTKGPLWLKVVAE